MKLHTLIGMAALLISSNTYAGLVGIWENGDRSAKWDAYISSNGMNAVSVDSNTSLAELDALDQVWLLRDSGNSNLKSYVENGGTLVTEWSGSSWARSAGLVSANLVSAGSLGIKTITFNQEGLDLGLGNRTGNPHSNSGGTQYFRKFNNLGSTTAAIATLNDGSVVGLHSTYEKGQVVVLGWDWQDENTAKTADFARDITDIPDAAIAFNIANIANSANNAANVNVASPMAVAMFGFALAGIGFLRKKRA
jgi:hypothetical protein